MNFDEYLVSKKIDAAAFQKAEPALFESWKNEFEQMHANSFTVQKLNLINPIRRKYQLKENLPTKESPTPVEKHNSEPLSTSPASPTQRVARPVYKPKPKIN